ncbi:Nitric oxide synthase, inducible, partial [Stegodyphus mimosarum]
MNDYDCKDLLSETFVIIVASTFGSGEPPDNGKVFWDTLKKMKERKISFKNLKYAVFALGSSHYPHFCKFGKDVDRIFSELGGERLMPLELSDELRGQEHTFNKWLPDLYKTSCQDFRLESVDELLIPDMNVSSTWKKDHFRFENAENKERNIIAELTKLHNKKLFSMKILSKTKLQASYSDRQTLLICLEASDPSMLNYEPGDHIAIFPTNPSSVVNAVLRRIKKSEVNCDDVVQLESFQGGAWKLFDRLPPASLRTYLKNYLDITTPPTSSLLYHLSEMASNPWDKYRLKRLSEVTDDYQEWKSYKYPHLAELLEEFPSINLDPTLLVSELPLLQPRYYSISSSKLANPNEVHITVTLVSYRMQDNKGPVHQGVCTSYLNSFPTEEIACSIRSATRFRLPEDPMAPVIMVGAGSGIAPFRSFWQERDAMIKKQQSENRSSKQCFGAMYLFFGCRQSTVDNLYSEELATLVQEGVITGVFTAFSREPGLPKVYVQHRLKKQSKLVLDSVSEGGHIYVCGDAVMAADVRSAFESILLDGNAITIDKLQENGHYHEDVFGILHRK